MMRPLFCFFAASIRSHNTVCVSATFMPVQAKQVRCVDIDLTGYRSIRTKVGHQASGVGCGAKPRVAVDIRRLQTSTP